MEGIRVRMKEKYRKWKTGGFHKNQSRFGQKYAKCKYT